MIAAANLRDVGGDLRWPLTSGFIHSMAIIVLSAIGGGPINFMLQLTASLQAALSPGPGLVVDGHALAVVYFLGMLAGLVGGGLIGAASLWLRSSAFADGLLLGEREADLRESLRVDPGYHLDPYCDRPGAGAKE